ncbi:MAG: hypothetical protein RSE36_00445 [Oscillospiraceae bacterium]
MRNTLTVLILAAALIFFPASLNAATRANSEELIVCAKDYDNTEVIYTGEVVGDALPRGEYVWLSSCDSNNSSLGIYIDKELAAKIEYYGDYLTVGDKVTVKGTFYRACAQHGGDLDIHADELVVDKVGHRVEKPVPGWLIAASCCVAIFAGAAVFAAFRKN